MSPILTEGVFPFYGVAADETAPPAVYVVCGGAGVLLYSTSVEEDEDGQEIFVFSQAERFTYNTFNGVEFGNGRFIVVANSGVMAYSSDGISWSELTSGVTVNLYDVCYLGSSVWIAVGASGTIIRSVDNGITWGAVTSNTALDLNAAAVNGSTVVAVGDDGAIVRSLDAGATWAAATSGVTENLNAVVWDDDLSTWIIVGNGSTILNYDAAIPGDFDTGTAAATIDLYGVAWAGADGLLLASGSGSSTLSSDNGINWTVEQSGATADVLYAVEYLGERFIAVGSNEKVAFSASGVGVRVFDKFRPVSEIYRSLGILLPRNTGDQARSPAFQRIVVGPELGRAERLARLPQVQVPRIWSRSELHRALTS